MTCDYCGLDIETKEWCGAELCDPCIKEIDKICQQKQKDNVRFSVRQIVFHRNLILAIRISHKEKSDLAAIVGEKGMSACIRGLISRFVDSKRSEPS